MAAKHATADTACCEFISYSFLCRASLRVIPVACRACAEAGMQFSKRDKEAKLRW
jgi:hypothetical protein